MLSRAPHIPSLRAHPCLALTSQAHAAHPDPDSGSAVESRRAKRILEHNKARDSSAHNREDKRALVAIVQFLCNGKSTASASKHWVPLHSLTCHKEDTANCFHQHNKTRSFPICFHKSSLISFQIFWMTNQPRCFTHVAAFDSD